MSMKPSWTSSASSAPLALLSTLLLLAATPSSGQTVGNATTKTERGLHATTFQTERGEVEVYLPRDLAASDTISGTVVARPSGRTPAATRRSSDRLQGYVVELEDQKAKVGSGTLAWTVPAAGAAATLVLRDPRGREVARSTVPVAPAAPPSAVTGVTGPSVGQTGRPVVLDGTFDGRFDSSGVTLGGREARLLAESPRRLVVESPTDVVGPTTLVVHEGDETFELPFRNVEVGLSAPRTNLGRGEKTTLTAAVAGLGGLDTPISLYLINESSDVVEMDGGDTQTIQIVPSEVGPDGRFVTTREIVGVTVGAFDISAQAGPPAPPGAPGGPVAQARPEPEPRTQTVDGAEGLAEAQRESEPDVMTLPGYVLRPEAEKTPRCCCPKELTVRWQPGPLEGDWPLSRYWEHAPERDNDGNELDWAGIFPVWGERIGNDVTNEHTVGPTDVPQVVTSQRKSEDERDERLPENPEAGVANGARNIGWRYQVIAEYEWVESEEEHECELHWEKQNKCTELKSPVEGEHGRLKPDRNGTLVEGCDPTRPRDADWYEIQQPRAFEPDNPSWDWRTTNTRKLPPGELDHPEKEIFVDMPQRIHLKGQEAREPTHFRWWIESRHCGCDRPFLGAEATLRFVKDPAKDYAEPEWVDFRDGITGTGPFDQFTPKTHYK